MAFNIVLNLALIPRFGLLGASLSTAVTYSLNYAILFLMFRSRLSWGPGPFRGGCCSFLLCDCNVRDLVFVDLLHSPPGPDVVPSLLDLYPSTFYFLGLVLFKPISQPQWRLLRQTLPPRLARILCLISQTASEHK